MHEYKYDIEIIIPISLNGKYAQRLIDFKKIGLLNVKDKKVLMTLLTGTEKSKLWENKWPENVDVRAIPGATDQETSKTYAHFSSLTSEDIQSRWIAKIDDDTANDISNLVDKLDQEYDCEREYYVVTELRSEQHKYEDNLLRSMGFNRWFDLKCKMWHELEGCIVSQAALKRIISNGMAMEFMRKRSLIPQGYNDYALACAAKICKIYPVDAYFMSRHPLIGEFSLFGGHLSHIHEISHDKNFHNLDLLKKMVDNNLDGKDTEIYTNIVNQEFAFQTTVGIFIITLEENGLIKGKVGSKIWRITGDNLEFLANNGQTICTFNNFKDFNLISGYYEDTRNAVVPQLRRLA